MKLKKKKKKNQEFIVHFCKGIFIYIFISFELLNLKYMYIHLLYTLKPRSPKLSEMGIGACGEVYCFQPVYVSIKVKVFQ